MARPHAVLDPGIELLVDLTDEAVRANSPDQRPNLPESLVRMLPFLDALHDPLLAVSIDGDVLFSNQAFDTLVGADGRDQSIEGMPAWLPTDNRPSWRFLLELQRSDVARDAGMIAIDLVAQRSTGAVVSVRSTWDRLVADDGSLLALLGLFRSDTSRDDAETHERLISELRQVVDVIAGHVRQRGESDTTESGSMPRAT